MSAASLAERARLGRLMAVDAWHAFLRRLTYYSVSWDALSLFDKAELRLVPQDIRTADPTIAEDIYAGRFAFAGEVIEERTQSPFEIIPPNQTWAEELHAFSWLRHLRASERAIAQANAQALVLDWIETTRLTNPYAWTPAILSTRILAWISQAPLILTDCDVAFYQKFARSLSRQVRFLRKSINNAPDGLTRVKAAIALSAASIAISNQTRFRRPSLRRLDQELQRQILPDGGHFSRNPAPIIEILLDLIPLRQAILAAQMVPSQTLMNAIDRMIPMIRFFQLGDGAFARFNGMGGTPVDLVAAILAHDDARGAPPLNASHSGYQRLQSDGTILIVDTGAPPPVSVSEQAHAGCLSFEMSAGNRPLIVNCGRPHDEHATLRRLARTTAAHSTLTLGNGSSCRFAPLNRFTASRGLPILSGPAPPDVTRDDTGDRTFLSARHDGYKRTAGYIHERSITLHAGGLLVEGVDSLLDTGQRPEGDRDFAIRFHLHPFVRPGPIEPGGAVRLTLRGGQVWRFSSSGSEMAVEESVYLSDIVGSLKTRQIVLYGRAESGLSIRWRLERLADLDILAGFAVEEGPFALESDRVVPEPDETFTDTPLPDDIEVPDSDPDPHETEGPGDPARALDADTPLPDDTEVPEPDPDPHETEMPGDPARALDADTSVPDDIKALDVEPEANETDIAADAAREFDADTPTPDDTVAPDVDPEPGEAKMAEDLARELDADTPAHDDTAAPDVDLEPDEAKMAEDPAPKPDTDTLGFDDTKASDVDTEPDETEISADPAHASDADTPEPDDTEASDVEPDRDETETPADPAREPDSVDAETSEQAAEDDSGASPDEGPSEQADGGTAVGRDQSGRADAEPEGEPDAPEPEGRAADDTDPVAVETEAEETTTQSSQPADEPTDIAPDPDAKGDTVASDPIEADATEPDKQPSGTTKDTDTPSGAQAAEPANPETEDSTGPESTDTPEPESSPDETSPSDAAKSASDNDYSALKTSAPDADGDLKQETPVTGETEPEKPADTPADDAAPPVAIQSDRIGPPREDEMSGKKGGEAGRRAPGQEFGTEFFMDDEFDLTFNVPPSMQLRPPGGPVKLPKAERKGDKPDEPDAEK
ncbi:MAG: heparinase II/III family protein [Pseudomonadota bacterium]